MLMLQLKINYVSSREDKRKLQAFAAAGHIFAEPTSGIFAKGD